jgi:tetratricopeptide (TPR) repeat protein
MKAILALALVAIAPGLCAGQDKMAEALRKGIVEEDTNHNLNAAIESYQSVVTQYEEDRKSAATAVFRIAECYRKLGKSKEAIAAYARVVKDFADQTKLAEQSRNQLVKTYKIPQQQTAGPVSAATAEARRKYREILQEGINAAQFNWDFIHKQYSLGAVSVLDTYEAQEELVRRQSRLAAFDAGLTPQAPAGPRTPAALAARARYKASLQTEVDFAGKNLDAVHTKYSLGIASQEDVVAAESKLFDAQLELAALDAGFAQPPSAAKARTEQ